MHIYICIHQAGALRARGLLGANKSRFHWEKVASGRAGLVRAPEMSAARRAALGTQSWGLWPAGGQRPGKARRGRHGQGVPPELHPRPSGDPPLGHNRGPALCPGPKSHLNENEKETNSGQVTEGDRWSGTRDSPVVLASLEGGQVARSQSGQIFLFGGRVERDSRSQAKDAPPLSPSISAPGGDQMIVQVSASEGVKGDAQMCSSCFATPTSLRCFRNRRVLRMRR